MNISFFYKLTRKNARGFVLPLTLVVCVIILTIATSISIILAKELYFSKLSRLSQVAYYAADNGLMCATMIDDQYIDPDTGSGIFQYNNLTTNQAVLDKVNIQRVARGFPALTLNDIKCATSEIFNASTTNFTTAPFSRVDSAGNIDTGITTTFDMRMSLGSGNYRCATVMVNKTPNYRQIISRGFASCDSILGYPVERAIVSTSESVGITESGVTTFASSSVLLTSGTSWTVPDGATSIKVWAIGAGGGGGGVSTLDNSAAAGGGAGGLSYRQFSVTSGQVVSYAIGIGGFGGIGAGNGAPGTETTVTVGGTTLRGRGGSGGKYNDNSGINGGSGSGGNPNRTGGDGRGAQGNTGGGGGGGLNQADAPSTSTSGGTGGQAVDVNGLFAIIASLGYSTTAPGAGGGNGTTTPNAMHGGHATGFGSGGGGAGYYGGNGGNGLFGGGGGGAAGYSSPMSGGQGGSGAVVIVVE